MKKENIETAFKTVYDIVAFIDDCFQYKAPILGYTILQRALRFNPHCHILESIEEFVQKAILLSTEANKTNWRSTKIRYFLDRFDFKSTEINEILLSIKSMPKVEPIYYCRTNNTVYCDVLGFDSKAVTYPPIFYCLLSGRDQPMTKDAISDALGKVYEDENSDQLFPGQITRIPWRKNASTNRLGKLFKINENDFALPNRMSGSDLHKYIERCGTWINNKNTNGVELVSFTKAQREAASTVTGKPPEEIEVEPEAADVENSKKGVIIPIKGKTTFQILVNTDPLQRDKRNIQKGPIQLEAGKPLPVNYLYSYAVDFCTLAANLLEPEEAHIEKLAKLLPENNSGKKVENKIKNEIEIFAEVKKINSTTANILGKKIIRRSSS